MAASDHIPRRGFMSRATEILGACIAAGLAIPAIAYLLRPARSVAPGGFVDVLDLTQLKLKKPEEVTFQRIRKDGWKLLTEKSTAWVVKLSENEVVAYSPQCTHLGCAYSFSEEKNEFVCPCHTTNFSIDGKVLGGPAPRPLDRYPTKVLGSRLLISVIEPAKTEQSKKGA
jgi:menaquinol-cytochrome c reductase iron-sulfur subunit